MMVSNPNVLIYRCQQRIASMNLGLTQGIHYERVVCPSGADGIYLQRSLGFHLPAAGLE